MEWNHDGNPSVSDEYIVTIEGAKESTTLYWDGLAWYDNQGVPYQVAAWQPFPAVYNCGTK